MPTGVYFRDENYKKMMSSACKGRVITEKTRIKISMKQKGEKNHMWGKHPSKKTLKKMSLAQTGRRHSNETKEKIRISHLGKKFTAEHIKNMSLASTGRKVSKETRIKLSKVWKGRKHTEKTKKKMSLNNKRRIKKGIHNFFKGSHPSIESRIKMSKSQKGRKHPKEVKEKIRKWHLDHPNRKFSNTKIEIKIEEELKRRKINYRPQEFVGEIALVDFFLPDHNVVIQADGCYYHSCPIHFPSGGIDHRKRDKRQNNILKKKGFKIYRFWEHSINKSVKKCIDKIREI